MRLATWNVNSIRARVARTVEFAVREHIDVLAMQEIKCKTEQFPYAAFEEAGYHVVAHGLNQWNGVAIASREPIEDVEIGFPGMPGFEKGKEGPDLPKEARALGATIDGVRVWSLYVPNGRGLDDPHYRYKLDWIDALRRHTEDTLAADPRLPLALTGDCNIAPPDADNGDPTVIEGGTTHVPPATRTGTTSSSASPATRGCASTSSSALRRSPMPSRAPRSTATSARARRRATTSPSSPTSTSRAGKATTASR